MLSTACSLRAATLDDVPFLRSLYASFRAAELAPIPWSLHEKQAFLNQQFDLQHRYYVATFPKADFVMIEKDGVAIGRLYIDLSTDLWHIIDIGLLPEYRGHGIGHSLLAAIKAAAVTATNSSIALHVDKANVRAYTLYLSLGFIVIDATDTHMYMRWFAH
ncbi:GNAT family N-acetyltransferase [Rhizobium sp. P38BS-XIX]|nr:GNAT family N-acetyltransferase [Rhizobium sp. P38BS-XIX]